MMDLDIEIDDHPVSSNPPGSLRRIWWRMANDMRLLLTERIENGEMPDGGPFLDGGLDRYSEKYERHKQRRGRYPYTPGDRFVLTGEMLANFDVLECDETGATIGFHTSETAERAWYNYQLRPAMDYTDDDFNAAFARAQEGE